MIEILIQGRQLGIPTDVPFIVPDLTGDEVAAAGDAAEGAITFTSWVSTADTPGNQTFVQHYRAKYGAEPSPVGSTVVCCPLYLGGSDCQRPIYRCNRNSGNAMANITDFDTVLGQFSFNPVGDAVYNLMILIVQNGNFEAFE